MDDKDNTEPPPSLLHASPAAGTSTSTRSNALENFKSFFMKCAIASTIPPGRPNLLATPHKTFIENRLQGFLPTPDHPPYAWMIQNAIKQLNEEGGSTEEAISNFISKESRHLPQAHATFLKYHLRKLCESSIILESQEGGHYMIGKAASIGPKVTSKPIPRFTYATSPDDPSLSPSPSSSSCSSSSTYASSSTSDSSQSFVLKRKVTRTTIKKKKKNIRARCCSRRGKGRDSDRSYDSVKGGGYVSQLEYDQGEATSAQRMMTDNNIDGNNQLGQNTVDDGCQSEQGNILIEIDSSSCDSAPAAKSNMGAGERLEVDYMDKLERHDEGDVLDQLIEEVYMELTKATKGNPVK